MDEAPPPANSNRKSVNLNGLLAKYRIYLAVAVIYLFLALLRFPDITANIATTITGAASDNYANLWSFWWVNYAVFHLHTSIYNTNLLFWPNGANLIYETMSPIGSVLFGVFQSISLAFAYNLLFFFGFAFTGLGMFVLAKYLFNENYTAFFAGLIFTFSTYHVMHAYSFIDFINLGWIPLALYFFIRLIREGRNYWNILGLSISMVLTFFMGDIEQGILALLLFGLVLLFYAIKRDTRHLVLRRTTAEWIAIGAIVTFVLGSWAFIPIIHTLLSQNGLATANQDNTLSYNVQNSMDIISFFVPSFYNSLIVPNSVMLGYYSPIFATAPLERTAYLTYVLIALSIYGVYRHRRSILLWIIIAAVFGIMSLGPFIQFNNSSTGIPGPYLIYHYVPLLNIIREPARFAIVFFIAFSILAAYGFKELLGTIEKKNINLPNKKYAVLAIVALIFFIESSGYPLTNISGIVSQQVSINGTVTLSHSINNTASVPVQLNTNAAIPPFYYSLRNTSDSSVLELPAIPSLFGQHSLYQAEAMYYTSASLKPILGGYLTRSNYTEYNYLNTLPLAVQTEVLQDFGVFGYYPEINNVFTETLINQNYTNQTLLSLYNFNTSVVVINRQAFNASALQYVYQYCEVTFGSPTYSDNYTIAFSTKNAINNALFKSFVSYQIFPTWTYYPPQETGLVNAWAPNGVGEIQVFTPASGGTNATLRFTAMSVNSSSTELELAESVNGGTPQALSIFNVTGTEENYSVRLYGLAPGSSTNLVLFATLSAYGQVLIHNVTVSK